MCDSRFSRFSDEKLFFEIFSLFQITLNLHSSSTIIKKNSSLISEALLQGGKVCGWMDWFCGGQAAAQILHARILLPIHTFHLESSRSFFPHFLHFSWIKNIIISTMQISHHCHFASYEISLSYEFECEDKKHSNIKNAGERGHRRCSSIWLADYSRRHIAHIFSSSIEGREGGSNKETTRYKNNMENVLPITIDYRVKLIFNYFLVLYS